MTRSARDNFPRSISPRVNTPGGSSRMSLFSASFSSSPDKRPLGERFGYRKEPPRVFTGGEVTAAHGMVLLEVVVALALFFGAAVVMVVGMQGSIVAAQNLKIEARAANLTITLLSKLQTGDLPLEDAGPTEYENENLANWTWEIVTEEIVDDIIDAEITEELPELKRVTIIVTYVPLGREFRLVRLMPPPDDSVAEEDPLDGLEGMPDVPAGGGTGGALDNFGGRP